MEFISLASGATHFPTPTQASEAAIKAIKAQKTFYGPTEGTLTLREAIAQRYRLINQAEVAAENILVTAGTKQALYNVINTLLNPGDEVIVPVPNWFGLHQVLEVAGAKIVLWPTNPENNYLLRPTDLEKLITAKTRLVLLSNPCNPTGRIYQKTELEALLQVLAQHPKIYLLSDEIYDLVAYTQPAPSLTQFPDPQGRHIVVNGFSKAFAMSGWRIGYCILPPDLYQKSLAFQEATISGVSEFIQEAAVATLQNLDRILPPMLAQLHQHRARMISFFDYHQLNLIAPEAAYFVFPNFRPIFNATLNSSLALTHYLKKNQALEILSGDSFGAPGFARLSFSLTPEKLETALTRLDTAFNAIRLG